MSRSAEALEDAARAAEDLARSAGEGVGALASEASERAGMASAVAAIVAEDTASSLTGALADVLERRPVVSLALVAALGFLAGAAWRRPARRGGARGDGERPGAPAR